MTENRARVPRSQNQYRQGAAADTNDRLPIIGDYASRPAQFKAGNAWTHVAAPGDVLTVARNRGAEPHERRRLLDSYLARLRL
jgi:hypothetical protein